jgi:hypothetical protein
VAGRIQAGPGIQAGVAFLLGHDVESPLHCAGFGIEELDEAGRVDIVAGAHQNVISDDDRTRRGEITLRQIGDRLVPELLAGRGIESDEVIVRGLHV